MNTLADKKVTKAMITGIKGSSATTLPRTSSKGSADAGVFDAVVGADEAALNATVAAFYATCRSLFTQTFTVNQEGITTVVVDFQAAPTVALAPTDSFVEHARSFVKGRMGDSELDHAIRFMTNGSITATCATVVCTINGGAAPVIVPASTVCGAAVNIQPVAGQSGYSLGLALSGLMMSVQGEPILSSLLNTLIAPLLLTYLNTSILGNITIPALALEGVTFAAPVVADETAGSENYLVGYTGLNPVVAPASGTAWPAGTMFAGVDAAALNAVASAVLPSPTGQGGIDDPNLDWNYQLGFTPSFQPQPGAGSAITATMAINGSASITWHTPNGLPNISFGATISGSATATASINAAQDGANQNISITINSVDNVDLQLDINGLPDFLNSLLSVITDAIIGPAASLAASVLSGFPIHVYTLSPISFQFANLPTCQLVLQALQLSQITGADGVSLVAVTATPAFELASSTLAPR
ncbi:hypothetical protein [Sorangium sp. So ce131]|uniref:hypothetical protein n=1 Tax=Sorangium sp. So ce131 TaxID=3133282 RepID=UPI003F648295